MLQAKSSSTPTCQACIEQLTALPPEIRERLIPVQDKAPKRPNWQNEPLSKDADLVAALEGGERLKTKQNKSYRQHYTGYGLRTGQGLLAIDIDGDNALDYLGQLSHGDLPDTVSWTSGKKGRRQLLYQLGLKLARLRYRPNYRSIPYDTSDLSSTVPGLAVN